MRKFMLFVVGLIALLILLVNLGPMIWLGVCVWLLYLIFKKFIRSNSTAGKIGWVILGLFVLTMMIPTSYAVLGIGAAIVLYFIFANWNKKDKQVDSHTPRDDDPFTNFEKQWEELNNY